MLGLELGRQLLLELRLLSSCLHLDPSGDLFLLQLELRLYLLIDSHIKFILLLGHHFVFLVLTRRLQFPLHVPKLLTVLFLELFGDFFGQFLTELSFKILAYVVRHLRN